MVIPIYPARNDLPLRAYGCVAGIGGEEFGESQLNAIAHSRWTKAVIFPGEHMKSRDQRTDEMLDRDEIRQLPIKYCHYIRNHMVDEIVELYVEEGVFENDPESFERGGVHRGKDEIEQLIRSNVGSADPWAFSHNHFIELEDDEHAHGTVYMEFRFGRHNFVTSHIGTYDDRYVKRNGQWKFLSRLLRTFDVLNRLPTG